MAEDLINSFMTGYGEFPSLNAKLRLPVALRFDSSTNGAFVT